MFFKLERLSHESDHEWLRDRLLVTNRQWGIPVGPSPEGFLQEEMPVHLPHCLQHLRALNASLQQLLGHHPLSGDSEVRHKGADLPFIAPMPGYYTMAPSCCEECVGGSVGRASLPPRAGL